MWTGGVVWNSGLEDAQPPGWQGCRARFWGRGERVGAARRAPCPNSNTILHLGEPPVTFSSIPCTGAGVKGLGRKMSPAEAAAGLSARRQPRRRLNVSQLFTVRWIEFIIVALNPALHQARQKVQKRLLVDLEP